MTLVTFLPGDGTEHQLEVQYIASDGAKGPDGRCAFCHGDPCAEFSTSDTLIAQYFERNRSWATTCPMCDGRPS